jgi:predicted membrane channel-forming protein YqfA (hemolysin III family)
MGLGTFSVLNFEAVTTVASSSSHTDAINLNGNVPVGLIVSTNTLVSTSITFETAKGSTHTFYALVSSSGGAVTVNTSTQAAQQYKIDPTWFYGADFIKCVMSSTSDVNKTLTWVTRPIA